VNSNFLKYALPLAATAVAASVGIWLQPPPAAPSTQQTIADFMPVSAPHSILGECDPQVRQRSGTRPDKLDELLHDCGGRAE